jgi:hypothetical protein
MCTRITDHADGILDPSSGRLRAAQAHWSRLTALDLSSVANKQDLITSVEERYGLSHALAVQDVTLWDNRIREMNPTTARSLSSTGVVT